MLCRLTVVVVEVELIVVIIIIVTDFVKHACRQIPQNLFVLITQNGGPPSISIRFKYTNVYKMYLDTQ